MSREGNPQDWLNTAELDRRAAHILFNKDQFEACVFHCQQAVEKLLKAIIVQQTNKRPVHAHSLRVLLEEITGVEINAQIEEAISKIDGYYVGSRYPIDAVDPGIFIRPLAEFAVQCMEEVFQWFLARIKFGNS